jgi:3D (Asp-Asp-Asp) domain-containing protein
MRYLVAMVALLTTLSVNAAPPFTNPVDTNIVNTPNVVVANGPSNAMPVTLTESMNNDVVLHFQFDSNDVCGPGLTSQGIFHRESPNSRSVEAEPFVVPVGTDLIVSHLSWNAFSSGTWTTGEYLGVTVGVNSGQFLFSTGTVITSDLAAARRVRGNLNINGGVSFREGETVCISSSFGVGNSGTAGPSLNGTILHGRLVEQ